VAGHNIARVTKANGIPYVILDLNAQRVSEAQEEGEPAVFGDCTSPHLLDSVGVREARVVVFVVSDPFATRLAVPTVRTMNKEVTILTRTKYIADIDELWDLGSREVIAEEFEASLELMTRILRLYNAPRAMVAAQIKSIRDQRFGIFRERHVTVPRIRLNSAVDVYTETMELAEGCPWHGTTIGETNLRAETGAWILGIIRGSQTLSNPGARERMLCGDRIVLSGTKDQLNRAVQMLTGSGVPEEEESKSGGGS
jgi:CPA2 family monovalent cation:H+ antiporter-2